MTTVQALSLLHTVISVLAMLLGVPAIAALFANPVRIPARRWPTSLFLLLAAGTSLTGFLFPFGGMTPALGVSVVALLVLAVVPWAGRRAARDWWWRAVHAGGIVISVYLLVFVAWVQAFRKLPALQALAPTQSEPPFAVAQLATLLAFVAIGIAAIRRTHTHAQQVTPDA